MTKVKEWVVCNIFHQRCEISRFCVVVLIRVDRLWNWPFQRKSCCSTSFHGIEAELFAEWKSWETLGRPRPRPRPLCTVVEYCSLKHSSTDDTHIAFEIRLKALYKPTVGEICALNLCCTEKEGDGWPLGRRWIGQTCLACVADSLAPRPRPRLLLYNTARPSRHHI